MRFPFWGICGGPWHRSWKQCLIVYTVYIPSLFFLIFCDFSTIFLIGNTRISFFGQVPYTLTTAPNNTDYHLYFFQIFFPILLIFFSFIIPILSIFGNMHWTLKTSSNINTNHPYFFLIFPYSLLLFYLAQPHFSYLAMHTGPWKQHWYFFSFFRYFIAIFYFALPHFPHLEIHTGPWNQHLPSPIFFWFFLFYCHFLFCIASLFIFENAYWTLEMAPIIPLFFFWFIAIFLFAQPHFQYLEICTGPWKQHSPSSFFSDFSPILLLFFIFHSFTFHIWKCALDPEISTYHPLFFSDFFPYFIAIFHFAQHHFPYLEMHTGPWKGTPQHHHQQWIPPPIFFLNFPLFYHYFSLGKAHISIFGSALLDPENSEQPVGNSEHQGWPWWPQQQAQYLFTG